MAEISGLRIAILLPSLHGGGAEFVAVQWGRYLANRGAAVTFLTTHARKEQRSEHLPGGWFGGRILALRNRLRAREFDVVLALAPHWNLIALLASRMLPGRPTIAISGRTIETGARRAGNNKAIELALARIWYRFADAFIAISHASGAEAQTMFSVPTDRLWVVPNPAMGKVSRRSLSSETDVSDSGTLHIVVPGRLTPSKRPSLAIQVAQQCAKTSGRPVYLHFFGSGREEEKARAAVPDDLTTIFHGWVENWFDHVPPGAVVLLPSQVEGFANVLVEAAAMGVPSVASSRALGVSDAIVPGITGQLALSDAPSDYAHAVLAAESIRPGAEIDHWLDRFSAQSSGECLEQAIMTAVARRDAER
ncbi:glycosyltransferase [Saxibacter everestensis]|uniref:D-inositol 3-phosphate glycosyltransferase n=1 Tax=Saxibacter everestensis TaxID=2909229 RepID=A0ABY8QUU4_9MICO|nr:glycosyltransferase [Brevibacteriaceae bacterium ZFBP1038]